MKIIYSLLAMALLCSCGTSSSEQPREVDSAKVDGTRLNDTLPTGDSVPPGVENPQPD